MVFLFYLRIFTVIFHCMRVRHVEMGYIKRSSGRRRRRCVAVRCKRKQGKNFILAY